MAPATGMAQLVVRQRCRCIVGDQENMAQQRQLFAYGSDLALIQPLGRDQHDRQASPAGLPQALTPQHPAANRDSPRWVKWMT